MNAPLDQHANQHLTTRGWAQIAALSVTDIIAGLEYVSRRIARANQYLGKPDLTPEQRDRQNEYCLMLENEWDAWDAAYRAKVPPVPQWLSPHERVAKIRELRRRLKSTRATCGPCCEGCAGMEAELTRLLREWTCLRQSRHARRRMHRIEIKAGQTCAEDIGQ